MALISDYAFLVAFFLGATFLATVFFFGATFLAAGFLAAGFLAAGFLATGFLAAFFGATKDLAFVANFLASALAFLVSLAVRALILAAT